MSKLSLTPNGAGTGTYTLASPNNNASHTLTLPVATGELLTSTGDGSGLTGISPFNPVAVTGATPSLDVGTYNFFDAGTPTLDTTLTFASVPTDANWRYKFSVVNDADFWDVSTTIYSKSFSVGDVIVLPVNVFFKPDGLKMYVVGKSNADVATIYEYDLSTAWDISTASYLQLFSVAAQENLPQGVFFKPDGLKMYVVGTTGDDINEYDLSTAWNITTASFLQSKSVSAQDTSPRDVFFKPDGLKMYVAGSTGDSVYEYTLSTAWNVTTASYLQSFSFVADELFPTGVFFKEDGLKMYVIGYFKDRVNEYDLSTAWNITTATKLQSFHFGEKNQQPSGVFFKPDGSRLFTVDGARHTVQEYVMGTSPTLTLPASLQNTPALVLVDDTEVTYEFVTDDAGVTVTLISEEVV